MSQPQNPNEIVIKNKYYPDGLTEQDIYDYWIKSKQLILEQTQNRDVIFYITPELDKKIVRRWESKDSLLRLTPTNYEKVLTGRITGVVSVMREMEEFGIIDIDVDSNNEIENGETGFGLAKKACADVYDFFSRLYPCQIKFTGKNSFHIICQMPQRMRIESIKEILQKQINTSNLSKLYETKINRKNRYVPFLDLSPNKKNGGFITLHSLNIIGLKSMIIDINDLSIFKKEDAKIK